MSVWQIHTIAVLMHFVTTPTDPLIAHVNLDIKEMDKTAQVVFNRRIKSFVFVCPFVLFSFHSLTTYFVCSYKKRQTADRNPLWQLSLLSLVV